MTTMMIMMMMMMMMVVVSDECRVIFVGRQEGHTASQPVRNVAPTILKGSSLEDL